MSTDRTQEVKIPCPTCKKETTWKDNPFRPFCSERCRLIDLGTWASEGYRIAGGKTTPSEDPENGKKSTDK